MAGFLSTLRNQDVDAVADSLFINNRLLFKAEPEGMRKMMTAERSSRANFYNKISASSNGSNMNLNQDFFDQNTSESLSTNKSAKSLISVVRDYLGI